MLRPASLLAIAAAGLLAGCERRPDDAPVAVSVIGGPVALADPARGPMSTPARVLTAATAQGLVRFDASGGIEPGLAERWIVIDEGRSYIFRLREAEWQDGKPVTTGEVVASLRRLVDARSKTDLAPFLAVIDEIVEMTPQVIEVRLSHPRPDLLKLFAQPEMAILRPRSSPLASTGPFDTVIGPSGWTRLRPRVDPDEGEVEAAPEPTPSQTVLLKGERASVALLRFAARDSDLVMGGTYRDWPLLGFAGIAPANVRVDPAFGLFGLAIVSRKGLLVSPDNREALAMAIDRRAITQRFRPEWQVVETILPQRLDSAADPTPPRWQALTLEERKQRAANRFVQWRRIYPDGALDIRIALPDAPGATWLWTRIARDLRDIGLRPYRVAEDDDADLRLIDQVAPYDSGRWYLANACQLCPPPLMDMIASARDAPTLAERARRIAAAELAMSNDVAYIPIAQPLRWSLVALRLQAWQENARAWHPLMHLRRPAQ